MNNTIPEILAPVADMEMCLAAVHNGANAIYVGVPGFNARGRTPDLHSETLAEIITFCRLRAVRVYFAMNVLIFERELRNLQKFLEQLLALKPDAFIVQDVGLAILLKQMHPAVRLHASTQMSIASLEAVEKISQLGFARAVLARELSIEDVALIAKSSSLELEVFVHGALCVAYSGQCLTSETFGGRSANRGQCAQSCRLDFELLVDGVPRDTQGRNRLFSPHDLCALPLIPRLLNCGIHSLKIEGRLKSPAYVAATVAAYCAAVKNIPAPTEDWETLFSRGFSTGWLGGTNHQTLVDGRYSGHRGEKLGNVSSVQQGWVELDSPASCVPGDGVLLLNPHTAEECGGRVYAIDKKANSVLRLQFSRELSLKAVAKGWEAWRNDSPAAEKRFRRSWTDRDLQIKIPIKATLLASEGLAPLLRFWDEQHEAPIEARLEQALGHSRAICDESSWQREITALGNTAYHCTTLQIKREGNPWLDQRTLRQLRQQAVQLLDARRLHRPGPSDKLIVNLPTAKDFPLAQSHDNDWCLSVLLRHPNQLDALEGLPLDTVILDFEYGKDYRPALARLQEMGLRGGIATLRVHRPGDAHLLRVISELRPPVVLVRNFGSLHQLAQLGVELRGDHSLNITNCLAMRWCLEQGLQLIQPGYDCNRNQLCDLLRSCGGGRIEVGLHQYLPTFHMEHCIFACYLSTGTSYPSCGKVCEQHHLEVRDREGMLHRLTSDAQCRNTLYLGKPQSALKLLPDLRTYGVRNIRLEMLGETAQQVRRKLEIYLAVLSGKSDTAEAIQQLGIEETYGITEGQLFQKAVWVNRKK